MEDGTENIEGCERGVDIEGDNQIGFGRVRDLEGKFGRGLSF